MSFFEFGDDKLHVTPPEYNSLYLHLQYILLRCIHISSHTWRNLAFLLLSHYKFPFQDFNKRDVSPKKTFSTNDKF